MKKSMIALALIAATSYANAAAPESGFYFGAGAGQTNFNDVTTESHLKDGEDTAWNAVAGYQLNKYFAVEAGWQDLGTLNDTDMRGAAAHGQNIEVSGATLGLVGTLPLSEKWFLTGEAGAYQYHLEHHMAADHYVSATDTTPYVGAGVGYRITDNMDVTAKYRRFTDIDETAWNTAQMDAETVGVQLTYRFGAKATPVAAVAPVVEPVPEPVAPKYETKVESASVAVLFGFDSATLSGEGQAKLDQIVTLSKQSDKDTLVLIGQADSQGDSSYNQRLSEKRIAAVSDYLTSRGVEVVSIDTQADGESKAQGQSISERQLDRRVIVTLTSEKQVQVAP
ncbi:outer membrane beta-barrel protein [Shewanella sp. JM162201]|uniref:Outer membrane beta-barrel protein n=1 Tax=Shewanella jiangmenensis TaxID=2837387 RepID=A0ABS5V0C8_9GAMM|nr:OmpA family protein [Shewanella jiangmenensis]MBT1443931.1 outer membrane beta-barrel protein [Shewanella jiangmenensis]